MKRTGFLKVLAATAFVIFTGLSLSSCATSSNAIHAKQRQGYMLMNKSEYSRNQGHFKGSKKPYKRRSYQP